MLPDSHLATKLAIINPWMERDLGKEHVHKEILQVPTKCVASTQNFAVKCGVQFIDFEGRTDGKFRNCKISSLLSIILQGESIFKLLQQLRPRRAILVRGSQQSLNSLRDFCSEVGGGEDC